MSELSVVTELGIEGVPTEIQVYLLSYCNAKSCANFSEQVFLDTYLGW